MNKQPFTAFISYARSDSFWAAHAIHRYLEENNVGTFLDVEMPIGTSWRHELGDEILKRDVMVAPIGARWTSERFVRRELVFAKSKGIPILPVVVEDGAANAIANFERLIGKKSQRVHFFKPEVGRQVTLEQVLSDTRSQARKAAKDDATAVRRSIDEVFRSRGPGAFLPSRQWQVDELIQLLQQPQDGCICYHGRPGSGKRWLVYRAVESQAVFDRYLSRKVAVDVKDVTDLKTLRRRIADQLNKLPWSDAEVSADDTAVEEYVEDLLPKGDPLLLVLFGAEALASSRFADLCAELDRLKQRNVQTIATFSTDGKPFTQDKNWVVRSIVADAADIGSVASEVLGGRLRLPSGLVQDADGSLLKARQIAAGMMELSNAAVRAVQLLRLLQPTGAKLSWYSSILDKGGVDSLREQNHLIETADREVLAPAIAKRFEVQAEDVQRLICHYREWVQDYQDALGTNDEEPHRSKLYEERRNVHNVLKTGMVDCDHADVRATAVKTLIKLVDFHRFGIEPGDMTEDLWGLWEQGKATALELDFDDDNALFAKCQMQRGWLAVRWDRWNDAGAYFRDGERRSEAGSLRHAICREGLAHVEFQQGGEVYAFEQMKEALTRYRLNKESLRDTKARWDMAQMSCELHLGIMHLCSLRPAGAMEWLLRALNGTIPKAGTKMTPAMETYGIACQRRLGDTFLLTDPRKAAARYDESLTRNATRVRSERVAASVGKGWLSLADAYAGVADEEAARAAFRLDAGADSNRAAMYEAEALIGMAFVEAKNEERCLDNLNRAELMLRRAPGLGKYQRLRLDVTRRQAEIELATRHGKTCEALQNRQWDELGDLAPHQDAWLSVWLRRLSSHEPTRRKYEQRARDRAGRMDDSDRDLVLNRLENDRLAVA